MYGIWDILLFLTKIFGVFMPLGFDNDPEIESSITIRVLLYLNHSYREFTKWYYSEYVFSYISSVGKGLEK